MVIAAMHLAHRVVKVRPDLQAHQGIMAIPAFVAMDPALVVLKVVTAAITATGLLGIDPGVERLLI